jgi:hypothetical protein
MVDTAVFSVMRYGLTDFESETESAKRSGQLGCVSCD